MELKLFGKSIFEFNKNQGSVYYQNSSLALKRSVFLPDFYSMSAHRPLEEYMVMETPVSSDSSISPSRLVAVPIKKETPKIRITPKGIFEMKMLNDKSININTNKDYIKEQLETFKDKLNLIKLSEGDYTRGITEISSILIRLENRKKYSQFKDFFENYPYTTNKKIEELIKKHNYFKIGGIDQFLADMPKEATNEMKKYTNQVKELCGKKPVFYVIADKEDFERTQKRRDPLLLAQFPFGHIWQILGVWDKEMLLLEEL